MALAGACLTTEYVARHPNSRYGAVMAFRRPDALPAPPLYYFGSLRGTPFSCAAETPTPHIPF